MYYGVSKCVPSKWVLCVPTWVIAHKCGKQINSLKNRLSQHDKMKSCDCFYELKKTVFESGK